MLTYNLDIKFRSSLWTGLHIGLFKSNCGEGLHGNGLESAQVCQPVTLIVG